MALDVNKIKADCKAAVLSKLAAFRAPVASVEEIQDAVAEMVTAMVPVLLAAVEAEFCRHSL